MLKESLKTIRFSCLVEVAMELIYNELIFIVQAAYDLLVPYLISEVAKAIILSSKSSFIWHVIIGIESDKKEDISDIEKLVNPPKLVIANSKRGRHEPCVCGSVKRYKKCCLESKI